MSDVNANSIVVTTPVGQLTARADGDQDYPSLSIYLNGVLVAAVEHDSEHGIRVLIWDKDIDRPQIINTVHGEQSLKED